MQRFTSAAWSPASQIANRFGSPAAPCSCCTSHRPNEWNVETKTSAPGGPASAVIRSRISFDALLVNVTARIRLRIGPLHQQIGDAVGDDAGLARASAGEDEERPLRGGHRLALRRVEGREIDHRGRGVFPRARGVFKPTRPPSAA